MNALQEKLASYQTRRVTPAAANGVSHVGDGTLSKAWQHLIDTKLLEWGQYPEQFTEDGLQPPAPKVLACASEFAAFCGRRTDIDPPLRVVPDGSGGVVFEWRAAPFFCTVEFHANGETEMLIFENSKLVVRQPIG